MTGSCSPFTSTMNNSAKYLLFVSIVLTSCGQATDKQTLLSTAKTVSIENNRPAINGKGMTIKTRFHVPDGFERTPSDENSFATYLRNLPLKPVGTQVKYFDGAIKDDDDVYD